MTTKRYLSELLDGHGHLNANKLKANPGHPDLFGFVKIAGKVYKLSAWNKHNTVSICAQEYEPPPKAERKPRASSKPNKMRVFVTEFPVGEYTVAMPTIQAGVFDPIPIPRMNKTKIAIRSYVRHIAPDWVRPMEIKFL